MAQSPSASAFRGSANPLLSPGQPSGKPAARAAAPSTVDVLIDVAPTPAAGAPSEASLNTNQECSCWKSFVDGLKCFGEAIQAVCTIIWKMICDAWNSMISCCYPEKKEDDTAPKGTPAPKKTDDKTTTDGMTAITLPATPLPDEPKTPPAAGSGPSDPSAVGGAAQPPAPQSPIGMHTPIGPDSSASARAAGSGDALIGALGAPLAGGSAAPVAASKPAAALVPFLAAPLSDELVGHINYVIDTSAAAQQSFWGAISLAPSQKELERRGAEIDKALHPLEFFAYQLINKKEQVKDIRKTAILGSRFVSDWAKHLMARPNLDGYLAAFYAHMGVTELHQVRLNGLVKARNWEGFYDHCLHNDLTKNPTGVPA
jgi:hypothetical protein